MPVVREKEQPETLRQLTNVPLAAGKLVNPGDYRPTQSEREVYTLPELKNGE